MKRRSYVIPVCLMVMVLLVSNAPRQVSAAIPCGEQELLESPTNVELRPSDEAVSIEKILVGPDVEAVATPNVFPKAVANRVTSDSVQAPTENIVRCLFYGDYASFATLITGEYRSQHLGVTSPVDAGNVIWEIKSLTLLNASTSAEMPDGRLAGKAKLLLDGHRLIVATLIFVERDDQWYLDDSSVTFAGDVTDEIVITMTDDDISTSSLDVSASDILLIGIDYEGETSVDYSVVHVVEDWRDMYDGTVVGRSFAGPPDGSVLVLHNLEPGSYRLTFMPDDERSADSHEIMIAVNP